MGQLKCLRILCYSMTHINIRYYVLKSLRITFIQLYCQN